MRMYMPEATTLCRTHTHVHFREGRQGLPGKSGLKAEVIRRRARAQHRAHHRRDAWPPAGSLLSVSMLTYACMVHPYHSQALKTHARCMHACMQAAAARRSSRWPPSWCRWRRRRKACSSTAPAEPRCCRPPAGSAPWGCCSSCAATAQLTRTRRVGR